jgi:hypothetical protein
MFNPRIITEPNAYLKDLKDKLETENTTYYTGLQSGFLNLLTPTTTLTNIEQQGIRTNIITPQQNLATQQNTNYNLKIRELRHRYRDDNHPIRERRATFEMQKNFQREELENLRLQYENAKDWITNNIDPARREDALNKLKDENDRLITQAKTHHEKQNKIMSELVHLAHLKELQAEYKKRYGKDAPQINSKEDMTALFKQSVKIGVKGKAWLYGSIEVTGNKVSFDISSKACREEAIRVAIINYRTSHPDADPEKPIELTLTLPEPSSEYMKLTQKNYIKQMELECAQMGVKLNVQVGNTTHAPDQQQVIKIQNKLDTWQEKQTEIVRRAVEKRQEDIETGHTEKVAQRKF